MKNIFSIIPQFLKDPQAFFGHIQKNENLKGKTLSMLLSSIIFLFIYGFATGLSHSLAQALSTALKMPALFLLTLAFTLPALYFFALALLNVRFSVLQALVVVLSGIGVSAFLLLGLAPVTLFFVLTSSDYHFFQLMAVVFVAISGVIGLSYILKGFQWVDTEGELSKNTLGSWLLRSWVLLYGFVGAQMTWRLSPLIGDPDMPFFYFRPSRDNFFIDVLNAVSNLFQLEGGLLGATAILICGGGFILVAIVVITLWKPRRKPKPQDVAENE